MGAYRDFHRRSIEQRDAFWAEQAQLIEWQRPFERVLDYSRPPFSKWFGRGLTQICHNAVDRPHAATRTRSFTSPPRPGKTAPSRSVRCMPRSIVVRR